MTFMTDKQHYLGHRKRLNFRFADEGWYNLGDGDGISKISSHDLGVG